MAQKKINCLVIGGHSESYANLENYLSLNKDYKVSITLQKYSDNYPSNNKPDFRASFLIIESDEDFNSAKKIINDSALPKPIFCIINKEDYKTAYNLMKAGADECFLENEINPEIINSLLIKIEKKSITSSNQTSLQILSSFISNEQLGIAIFNTNGKMIDCNDSFYKIYTLTKKRILNKSIRELCEQLSPEDVSRFESFLKNEIYSFDYTRSIISKNDEIKWYRIYISLVRGNSLIPSIYLMRVIDITDDLRVKKQLEEEKYLLQTLLDNIPYAIYFKDYAHRYIKVSRHSHIIGIENPEDAIGKTDFDFPFSKYAKSAFNDEEFIINNGYSIVNKIEKLADPQGNDVWISTTKSPLFDTKGNITGIVGISRNVTDFLQKEEELRKSEERYRNLIENSPDTIGIIIENKIVFTNKAGIQLIKARSIEDLLGRDIKDFIPYQFSKIFNTFLGRAISNNAPFRIDNTMLINLAGEFIDVEVTGIPTTYLNKSALQLIIRDITESKRQEKLKEISSKILQLTKEVKTLDELFQYIHFIIGAWMPVENFSIALYDDTNDSISFAYNTSGNLPGSKNFGKGISEFVINTGNSYQLNESNFEELAKKGKIEIQGNPPKVWLGVPLQIGNKTIGVMSVQDYSNPNTYTGKDKAILEFISFSVSRAIELKMAEEEKHRYIEQLKDSNSTKDRFFSFISHDLRGPFSSLLGFSELALDDFRNHQSKDLGSYLEIINKSAKNLYNLLNNLLQFSRFQTGRYNFEPGKLSVSELVKHNIELINGNAVKKGIEIVNYINGEDFIFADEEMIHSAFQNILTNSIKFTPRGGKIFVDAEMNSNGKEIDISFTDTGVGMSKEVIDKLFRIDIIQTTSGTEKESGTGLGLLILKECVEKNNGRIRVESEPGRGTKFIITLPLAPSGFPQGEGKSLRLPPIGNE